jgi:hypothetical protein
VEYLEEEVPIMAEYVFEYRQGADIRWYASEVLDRQPSKPSAQPPGTRVTNEGGEWVTWMATSTSFGVCFGLSAWWIIKKAKGEDFLGWLKPGGRACPSLGATTMPGAGKMVLDVREIQLGQRGKDQTIKMVDAMERVKRETGFVDRDSVMVKDGPLKEKEGFNLIILTGTSKGAPSGGDLVGQGGFNHAIAVQVVSKTKVYLFDPNRGEILLSCVAEANAFIDYLCKDAKQYNLASYEMAWCAVAGHRIKKGQFS